MEAGRKAMLAQQILDNPLWDDLYEDMKQDLFEQFCSDINLQTRERISLAVDLIDDLREKIEAKMVEGTTLNMVGDNNG